MSYPTLKTIENAQGIKDLKDYLSDKDFIAYDCETTGVHKGAEVIGVSVCASEQIAYYVILGRWNVMTQTLDFDKPLVKETSNLIQSLVGRSLLMHNGVFDCSMAEDFFNISLIDSLHTDTMVLAHLLNENRRIGLKDLGVSIFGINADQESKRVKASVLANGGGVTKDNYELYKADPQIIAEYGAKDAWLTYKLFMELVPQLYEQKLDKFFYEDESMPLLRTATYQLNRTGLKVDTQALTTLKKTLEAECEEAKAFIHAEIQPYIKDKYPGTNKKNTFNIGATQQLSWLMFGQLKLEFSTLTDAGKEACKNLDMKIPYSPAAKREFIEICHKSVGLTQFEKLMWTDKDAKERKIIKAKKFKQPWAYIACDKKTLQKHAHKYKWIDRLLKYQKNKKLLSTYIEGIEERTRYGVIHPSFLQTGTTSGRYSSRNPNFQNLPRDDKRVKDCFVARPGKVFVGADFSQLEVRVFASVSEDPTLIQAFKTGEDFYSTVGIPVFGAYDSTPYKDGSPDAFGVKYKDLRKMSKEIALATTYGANAFRLSGMINKTQDETQEIIDAYFEKFFKVKEMMNHAHELAMLDGQVSSTFGRLRRMPEAKRFKKMFGTIPKEKWPYEARNLLNLAVNHRIQSTAASICNRAMIAFCKDTNALGLTDCPIVSQIHDEIIVECREEDRDTVILLLQNAMETDLLPNVALEAIPTSAKTLGGLK